MTAYYSEFDPFAAAWLRNLIAAGHIAPGDVDERDLWDVSPDDLRSYTQVHLCAGIGVWSYALRQAGWSDDRPVWTASFPCQPFSAAGKGAGFADERHLWPAGYHLIRECDPAIVLGEQVASKDGLAWLDLVRADLEASGRSFAAADLCAAGIGAPHIRQRSFWMADSVRNGTWYDTGEGMGAQATFDRSDGRVSRQRLRAGVEGSLIRLDDDDDARSQGYARHDGAAGGRQEPGRPAAETGVSDRLEHGASDGRQQRRAEPGGRGIVSGCGASGLADASGWVDSTFSAQSDFGSMARGDGAMQTQPRPASPTNGFWRDADWLYCRDGKWRPVEPGTFPLAHGAANRVGRLRGYGNAIVAPLAVEFIEAVIEAREVAALLS